MLSVEEISVFLYLQMNHLHALTPKGKKPSFAALTGAKNALAGGPRTDGRVSERTRCPYGWRDDSMQLDAT